MKRTPVPIVVLVVLVLVSELGLRAISGHLQPPIVWANREVQHKVAAMDALRGSGGASVVFVGSSMTNAAASPQLATRLLKTARPAFNASINGVDLVSLERWVIDVVLPRLKPRAVVIGVSSRELNANGVNQRQFRRAFVDSVAVKSLEGRARPLERLDLWSSRYSYLLRYRRTLRRPTTAVRHVTADDVNRLGVPVSLPAIQSRPYRISAAFTDRIANRVFNDYAVGRAELGALDRLVGELQALNIKVVVLEMPLTRDAVGMHPDGDADYAAFTRAVRPILTARSAPFVDMRTPLQDTKYFFDPLHLNRKGAALFTERLVSVLGPMLRS